MKLTWKQAVMTNLPQEAQDAITKKRDVARFFSAFIAAAREDGVSAKDTAEAYIYSKEYTQYSTTTLAEFEAAEQIPTLSEEQI